MSQMPKKLLLGPNELFLEKEIGVRFFVFFKKIFLFEDQGEFSYPEVVG